MADSHIVSALIMKISDLSGERDYHRSQLQRIERDLETVQSAVKVFDPDYDLRTIKTKRKRQKNCFFRSGEGNTLLMDRLRDAGRPITTTELVESAAKVKGYDLEKIDRRAFTASLFTILKRLQARGICEEVGRRDNVIVWQLSA